MKHIVVLGGGFAGVATVHNLRKKFSKGEAKITLIDKRSYHLFTPSLYEVATSEEPKGNIAFPFTELFDKKVTFIKAQVLSVNPKEQTIKVKDGEEIPYDYLVLALGSEPAYYHIPGLKEYSITLKSLQDAVIMRNKIMNMCCKEGECKRKVQVVIGGGGFSGTELAAELLTYKSKLARQHHLSPSCLEITIIQGSNRLLNELDERVSKLAEKRVKGRNVHFAFGGHIAKVTDTSVFTDNNNVYPYDILVWTGGVEGNQLAQKSNLPVNKRGQVVVNDFLQIEGFKNVFAVGDNAQFIDKKSQHPVPTVAPVAEDEGKVAAENIIRSIKGDALIAYKYFHFGYVVPLKGRYAVAQLTGGLHFDGVLGWALQQIVLLRYLLGILSFPKAFAKWNNFEEELKQ